MWDPLDMFCFAFLMGEAVSVSVGMIVYMFIIASLYLFVLLVNFELHQ
jgi:hypothetical protein